MRGVCLVLLAVCVVLVSRAPVSAADDELATVGGKVTFNGKPLTDAVIIFHFEDDQFVGGTIKDGKFKVDRVPVGTAKVTVESKTVGLPAKFASPETSGMTVEIKKDKVPLNLMLTGREEKR